MTSEKETEVKISIIDVIYRTVEPIGYRLDSLLRDYYTDALKLSNMEYTLLMELRTATSTLTSLLGEYLDQAREFEVEAVFLSPIEFTLILELSKTVELAHRTSIGQVALWAN